MRVVRPPGPRGWPILGSIPGLQRDGLNFLQRVSREYGDIVYLSNAAQSVYFLNHPDLTREVLVNQQHKFKKSRMLERARVLLGDGLLTSEGALHRRQRRLVQPAFHRERLIGYSVTMVERARAACGRWHDGQPFDMSQEMMRLTLDIVCRTLFSAQIEGEVHEIEEALTHVFGIFGMVLLPFSEYLEKLPIPLIRRFHKAKARLDATIYRLIAERRASGEDKGDLLSMLLLAQDQGDDGREASVGMTDQQVRDEVLTLFLAGHETTANALTWTWYLLSQNPEAANRMRQELQVVLDGRLPTVADLEQLRYTNAVFSEGLRLYPPAWAIGRRALEDIELGSYLIPKGSVLLMSPYVTHRDARWFPEPEAFRPERWLPGSSSAYNPIQAPMDQKVDQKKFAYFPFGGGARVCIGERFAGMEGVLLLAAISQNWAFDLQPGHPVAAKAQITLRPKFGMRMIPRSVTLSRLPAAASR